MADDEAAAQILREMGRRYAALRTYRDVGRVIAELADGSIRSEVRFATHFERPNRFRFDFLSPHSPGIDATMYTIVACDGARTVRYLRDFLGVAAVKERASLRIAVAGATGESQGAAHTIARLLLPDISGLSLPDLQSPRLEASVDIDGAECWRITASEGTNRLDMWIEKESFLLRRLQTRMPGAVSEEIRRDIVIDAPVDPSEFAPPFDERSLA